MTYLKELLTQIQQRNFTKFMELWEEYCASDVVDSDELLEILQAIKESDFAKPFSKMIESAIPLWKKVSDPNEAYNVLKLLFDLQTSNTPELADLATQAIKDKYPNDPLQGERLRLVGLRTRDQFQGCLSKYDLLAHLQKGKFIFHRGGWGTGEIVDVSPIRQQVSAEFEHQPGIKHVSFEHAFKSLVPLSDDHFLARRFGNPDALEAEAMKDAVNVVKLLLRDLGPKTAGEIKEELSEWVIPEESWTKWWQNARAKLKQNPLIESPESLREPFRLRSKAVSQDDRLERAIEGKSEPNELIQAATDFLRDLPNKEEHREVKETLRKKLEALLESPNLTPVQELLICICLDMQFSHRIPGKELSALIQKIENPEEAVESIDILAMKKRILTLIREHRADSTKLFFHFLLTLKHNTLRDYVLKDLNQPETQQQLENQLKKLLQHPETHPEFFIWYFQKSVSQEDPSLPFGNKEGHLQLLEAYLLLINRLESKPENKEIVKKMIQILFAKRYEIVRKLIEEADIAYVTEFLLLASKCQEIAPHDMKILRSLAAVVHPSLDTERRREKEIASNNIIWTTEEGFRKVQERVKQIGTTEIVENAREIEVARAHGDLRENAEFKSALERRSRLQGELKTLSDQINRARVLTTHDILLDEVGVGNIVEVINSKGSRVTYTILGPWDADVDKNIISFQSQLAQLMAGCKSGDKFQFRDETLTIGQIRSYLES